MSMDTVNDDLVNHPLFRRDAIADGEDIPAYLEALRQLKYSEEDNSSAGECSRTQSHFNSC